MEVLKQLSDMELDLVENANSRLETNRQRLSFPASNVRRAIGRNSHATRP